MTAQATSNLQRHGLTIENIINTSEDVIDSLICKVFPCASPITMLEATSPSHRSSTSVTGWVPHKESQEPQDHCRDPPQKTRGEGSRQPRGPSRATWDWAQDVTHHPQRGVWAGLGYPCGHTCSPCEQSAGVGADKDTRADPGEAGGDVPP